MTPTRFDDEDSKRAHRDWGANCGPGALAGILGLTLDEVHPHIPDFDAKRYTSPAMMNAALRSLGAGWRKIGRDWPHYGLARIQWHGPWMAPGVPHRKRYPESHWIGVDFDDWLLHGGKAWGAVFDINCMASARGWIAFEEWKACLVPWLLEGSASDGTWSVMCAIEIAPPDARIVKSPDDIPLRNTAAISRSPTLS